MGGGFVDVHKKAYKFLFTYTQTVCMSVKAALVTYRTEGRKFRSRSERNKFYRGLYGYRRTVRRNDTVYEYEKEGLLGEVPHVKVADSVFIVRREHLQPFKEYFANWNGKVEVDVYLIEMVDERLKDDGDE